VSAPRSGYLRLLAGGALLVLAGVACWAMYAVQSGREHRAYAHGGTPRSYVHLVAGHLYFLAVPGGVKHLDKAGVQVSALQCTAAAPGQAPGALSITSQSRDTKAIDQIASFSAVRSGYFHIECDRLGAVFVDGTKDGFDWSGLWLILASVALVIGIPLTLSGRRLVPAGPPRRRADDDDDFEPSVLFGSDEDR
jgi:hypothetical protein